MRQSQAHGQVASHTPGRLRVRLAPPHRQAQVLQAIHAHLEQHPAICTIETRQPSGSVVVRYDPSALSGESLLGLFHAVGVVVHDVGGGAGMEPVAETPARNGPGSVPANSVMGALDDADRRLAAITGHRLDLKLLFPLTVGALGLRQLLASGWGLTEVPAFVLLWYAFDAFWKLHVGRPARGDGLVEPDE